FYWFYTENNPKDLYQKFMIVFATFYVFTHIHPQYFLWITPLIIIDLVKSNFKYILLVLVILVSYIFSILFFEASLNVNLFAPVFPNLYVQPTLWEILKIKIDLNLMRSWVQTIFTAAFLVLIYINQKNQNSSKT
ncbi:MAG: hypothetical protein AABY22_21355, partial [Nanoarchaeota archaeon]